MKQKSRKTIPKAINNVPIRILLFYIGGLLVIMSVIPWFKVDPDSSPFVKLFTLIGVPFAAGIVNFVVLTAASATKAEYILIVNFIWFSETSLGPKVLQKLILMVCLISQCCIFNNIVNRRFIKFYFPRCY